MSSAAAGGGGFYGASLVLGALAATEFVLVFLPKLAPLGGFIELVELYIEHIIPNLTPLLSHSLLTKILTGLVLLWASSYAALEAFTREFDNLSLWNHIGRNSCGRKADGSWQLFFCTAWKWLITVLSGPVLIVWGLIRKIQIKTRMVSIGYVTINPNELVKYIRHLVLGFVIVLIAISAAWRLIDKNAASQQGSLIVGGSISFLPDHKQQMTILS